MNSVILTGRLTAEPELKYTASGTPVCSFILAVDRNTKKDEADFPNVVAWRNTAEFASKYLGKGRKIIVEGELRTRTYEDKNGTKHKVTEVFADRIEFADSKKKDDGGNTESAGAFSEIEDDGDLPFN